MSFIVVLSLRLIVSLGNDPGTIFIRKDVQDLLLNITGFDLSRIFRQRTNKNFDRIVYKYLTDKQLKDVRLIFVPRTNDWLVFEQEQEKTVARGRAKLQMPPILSEAKENIEILEEDPMLAGFSSSRHLFIDISLGVPIRVSPASPCPHASIFL